MPYMINLTTHLESLAQCVSFELSPLQQIELEGLLIEITDGAPAGFFVFDEAGVSVHPVLLMGSMGALSAGIAALTGVDEEVNDPLSWAEAGYPVVAAAFNQLIAEGARKMMEWSTEVLADIGYCPLSVLQQAEATGLTFDQVKTQQLFNHGGLRSVGA